MIAQHALPRTSSARPTLGRPPPTTRHPLAPRTCHSCSSFSANGRPQLPSYGDHCRPTKHHPTTTTLYRSQCKQRQRACSFIAKYSKSLAGGIENSDSAADNNGSYGQRVNITLEEALFHGMTQLVDARLVQRGRRSYTRLRHEALRRLPTLIFGGMA